MTDYDPVIESIVAGVEVAQGMNFSRFSAACVLPSSERVIRMKQQARWWTPEEMDYLRRNITVLPVEVIAARLGRSVDAVKIKQVRSRIHAKSRYPGYLTGHQVSHVLCIDIHTVMKLHKRGLIPMEILPGQRGIMRISVTRLYMWATCWRNWIYFKAHRVRDLHLRRLIQLAQSRWGDEWISIGRAASILGVSGSGLNKAIRAGRVSGAVFWSVWYLRRSALETVKITAGKGSNNQIPITTPRQDAFMLKAAREGKTYAEISRMMKWRSWRSVSHHLKTLGYKRIPQWQYRKDKD